MTLLEINKAVLSLDEDFSAKYEEFKKYKEDYISKKNELLAKSVLCKHQLDIEKFERGKSLLRLQFPKNRKGLHEAIYPSLVVSAIQDLTKGAKKLQKEYIGQKRYQGYDQRCDCKYGFGPTYGYIYQSIGLEYPEEILTDNDIDDCLYVLENIDIVLEQLNRTV